jgi:predicted nucleic acid-binding Zn ribbon protein
LRFEVKRGFNESGGNACPQCGREGRQIFFPAPLHFKGSGFYVTDSRKKSPEEAAAAKPDSSKVETGPPAGEPSKKSETAKSEAGKKETAR